MFNPSDIKKDFPIFEHYPSLIFADNASTTQKPLSVIRAITDYYTHNNANVHRAVYDLGIKSDDIYHRTRKKILDFYQLDKDKYEAIYTAGTTDGFYKLARGIEQLIKVGDNIIVSEMEHHSNLIPWQELCKRTGAELRVAPFSAAGLVEVSVIESLLDQNTKIVSLVHISNTLGSINPLKKIGNLLENTQAHFFVDAAQSAAFYGHEFANISADAFVFGAHKMFGPSGIGVLLAKHSLLAKLAPFNYGGGMVTEVEKLSANYRADISKFEAGTPALAQVAGLNACFDYLTSLDLTACCKHVQLLSSKLRTEFDKKGINVLGDIAHSSGIVSAEFGEIHPHDVATFLNSKNIAVRAGHHSTQLIMKKYDIHSSVRFSFTIYNEPQEINQIMSAIEEMQSYFS